MRKTSLLASRGAVVDEGAVNALKMAMGAELKEHGVRANVVCPGARMRLSSGRDYERTSPSCTTAECSRQILVASGGFLGRFDCAALTMLGYRNHRDSSPWTIGEVGRMVAPRKGTSG